MSNNIVFCIPVRGGSKRIPRKNMTVIDGETILARKIRQVSSLGSVVVGSDDEEMLAEARRHGAVTVRRKCTDEGSDTANDMIGEFMVLISQFLMGCEGRTTIVWSHCTNPLISTMTYHAALVEYERALKAGYDSLVSVHEIKGHYWSTSGRPLYDVDKCRVHHMCASELPPLYEQDGGIFIQPYRQMMENQYFFGQNPYLFKTPEREFLDINEPRDVLLAKAVIEG